MRKINFLYLLLLSVYVFTGCSTSKEASSEPAKASAWPRGITYEIFVQSFCDSDNDGIGDIKGMTSKLDYIKNLGVEAVWLMPMSPSPSYHKYDVTDYYGVHPDYGTKEDFKEFVAEAHKRNIKVVIDLVLNHSSSEHPWFKSAMSDKNSPYRDYYVWAHKDDPQTQKAGEIIAGDSDNVNRWHQVEGSDYLYYGYFYGGMPDLNYDNPKLREEVFSIGRYWLNEFDVDGFRLDAARHIFPDDRPKDNHQWWVDFKNEMQKAKEDVYLVGEVWADAETVAPYMKGLHALFNFDMGYAITNVVNKGKVDSLIINHKRIREFYESVNPDFVDATFLTNHDQNRIMSEVNDNENKAKMAAALLLTLPGSPYLYFGEEIGMKGKKPDEFIREPFIWNANAEDDCRANWVEPKFSTAQTVTPASQQSEDKNSMLNHYKTFIHLRNNSKALTYGDLQPVDVGNEKVAAFRREYQEEALLVLHNLSDNEISVSVPADLTDYNTVYFKNKDSSQSKSEVKLSAFSTLILRK
ncbi:alpha-amylase family glycosyl hydrolase [Pontibacter silvestris]|uniref:Alpha-amylase n=1 Tax=Pontibacter silvestris TaxID=2305183 RepID=A0ABW4X0M7_9BACT|nr:alpha-amylase family glycosyl hydrolase [Pontibacter silvestris]MCC9136033.1 alpha-glucosidase C-terminal domain-containing protein [Pontibacter silvestris]